MTTVRRFTATALSLLSLLSLTASLAAAQSAPPAATGPAAKSLRVAITLPDAQTNGVAVEHGRTFMVIARQKGQNVPQIAEYVDGQLKPYPDAGWNNWTPGEDGAGKWVHANSVRFGPDGTLWVVDFGAPGFGEHTVPHGPKLVGIHVATGKVVETLYLDSVLHPESAVDDVRFNGPYAYLTDAGWPGLIVVHQPDGRMWRALTGTPSVTAGKPLRAEGHELQDKNGKPIYFHADQIEVSPDGKTVYYMPCSGPLAQIAAAALNDANLPDSERVKQVKPFAANGSGGGTAIDSRGNVYVSEVDFNRIMKITPDGTMSLLVADPRLVWVDAMWITPDGRLWMPAAQMDRTPGFNDDKMTVQYPMQVFTVDIGNGPSPIDHK